MMCGIRQWSIFRGREKCDPAFPQHDSAVGGEWPAGISSFSCAFAASGIINNNHPGALRGSLFIHKISLLVGLG